MAVQQDYETTSRTDRAHELEAWRRSMADSGWEFVVRSEAGERHGYLEYTMVLRRPKSQAQDHE